jgi:hypothetical protein
MGHPLQIDLECGVELRHGSGQHHGAPGRILLHHGEPVGGCELAHGAEIRGICPEAGGKFFPAQERARCAAGRDSRHPGRQLSRGLTPHQ